MNKQIGTGRRREGWEIIALLALIAGLTVNTSGVAHAGHRGRAGYHPPGGRYMYSLTVDGATYGTWLGGQAFIPSAQGDRLLVQRDAGLYTITDHETIHVIAAILDPLKQMDKAQGDLGKKQSELGRRQGELSARQGELGRQIAEIARGMAHASGAKLADLQRKMDAVGRQQAALAERQKALGRDQSELGKSQEALGHKQAAGSRGVIGRIDPIIDAAFSKGLARRVPLTPRPTSAI